METEDNTELVAAIPGLVDPAAVAPEVIDGVIAEGDVLSPIKVEGQEVPIQVPIPLPPPLDDPAAMPEPAPVPVLVAHHPAEELIAMVCAPAAEEITITDQDVLFGRGGLTNRHIGNLRYRDIISIHRQDYVRAQKTEKPNVARRIVKAIRTGKNPGRFLRKGEDGKWHAVSDKEAAWKASQALREKSRWSSMKPNNDNEEQRSAVSAAVDLTVQKMVEAANLNTVEKAKKRKAEPLDDGELGSPEKKAKSEEDSVAQPPPLESALDTPTQISHITVPPVDAVGGRKVEASYMLNSSGLYPRDEDILFGRGGRTNHHPGNKRLREIVEKYRETYNKAKKVDKPKVSKLIVNALRSADPPSRFLRMNDITTRWEEVGDKRAAEKVSQTLREKDREEKAQYLARKAEADAQQHTMQAQHDPAEADAQQHEMQAQLDPGAEVETPTAAVMAAAAEAAAAAAVAAATPTVAENLFMDDPPEPPEHDIESTPERGPVIDI